MFFPKVDNRTFYDMMNGTPFFRTTFPVSSAINEINSRYVIQGIEDKKFYEMKFE
ncbi:hypothetical protein J4399_04885 [Candidatus Woesearchaeota archaeon]|nr:hypothetical protein [Candidatus Woesearchaeota archaeon]HIJ01617.1 hypothetical protein [Candidatus Woesearchaeota archaeon]